MADAEHLYKKIPVLSILNPCASELKSQIKDLRGVLKAGHLLRSECLLLIAVSCKTSSVGSSLARREIAALQHKDSLVDPSSVHPVLLKGANALL